jgi:hypothetical protein
MEKVFEIKTRSWHPSLDEMMGRMLRVLPEKAQDSYRLRDPL